MTAYVEFLAKGRGKSLPSILIVCFGLCWLVVVGCSSGSFKIRDSDRIERMGLEERVRFYWKLFSQARYEETYRLECPVYRKVVPLNVYVSNVAFPGKINKFSIQKIDLDKDGKKADVFVKMEVKFSPFGSKNRLKLYPLVKDRWLKVSGVWCHYPRTARLMRNKK